MKELAFTLNAILPILLLVGLGYLLKKVKIVDERFISGANRLCFRILIPVLLFNNIYLASLSNLDVKLLVYCIICVLVLFVLGLIWVKLFVSKNKQKGVVLQSFFRSNYAIMGIPLAQLLVGDKGVVVASVVAAIIIPLFNILAVISLTVFDRDDKETLTARLFLKNIAKNPLIIGVCLALVFIGLTKLFMLGNINIQPSENSFIYITIEDIAKTATPLALICLGANFSFESVKKFKKELFSTVFIRLFVVPISIMIIAYFIGLKTGIDFAVLIAAFGTPIAVSSAPMAQEMGQDSELAGQIVVWTSLVCGISLFLLIYGSCLIGVFS